MSQLTLPTIQPFPLAEILFSSPEQLKFRQEISRRIRERAVQYPKVPKKPGKKRPTDKRTRLLNSANRYETCGMTYMILGCQKCTQRFVTPNRCESRICDTCTGKFAARVRKRLAQIFRNLSYKNNMMLIFLTLTKRLQPGTDPTTIDARKVMQDTRKLVKKLWPKSGGCGAFAVLETGKKQHLHIHLIIYGRYVPQPRISNEWLKLTLDSSVVFICSVRGAKKASNYLLKYITKPPEAAVAAKLAKYLDLITGLRRIHSFGIFYNYKVIERASSGCPICKSKLSLIGFDPGRTVPSSALMLSESYKIFARVN